MSSHDKNGLSRRNILTVGAGLAGATLLPGGRVELASPSGDPTEGVVPTCLVQNVSQLKHKLRLKKPCKFDVKLEQRGDQP